MRNDRQPHEKENVGRNDRPDTLISDSLLPDGQYRPIPIVWFAGAVLMQVVLLPIIFLVLISYSGYFTVGATLLATGVIGFYTWERGMAEASMLWRGATIVALLFNLALVCLATTPRL